MRVLVSVDMEGVAGVVAPEDVSPGHPEYERNRLYMTNEANAAVRGIRDFDAAASIVVCDGHAGYRNLLPDRLERGCTLLRGKPRANGMVSSLEDGVDAVCFVGYHARAGTAGAVLAHTVSGAAIARVRGNGHELGELGLNAALAAYFGARPIVATGDDQLVREAEAVVPGIVAVEVKRAFGDRAADSLHPEDACARIQAEVHRALRERAEVTPPIFDGPVDLEVDLLRPVMTELAAMIPGVERRGPTTLGFLADQFPAAYNLIRVFAALAAV